MGTREHLIQVASEIIKEAGFERLTTAALARRAGMAEGTLYRHFPGKADLVEAVFAHGWGFLNDYMEAHLPPRSDPKGRLDAFFAVTLRGMLEPEMLLIHGLAQSEHMYWASKRGCGCELPPGLREYVALLEEAIGLAQAAGHVRPELNPKAAALFLFSGASTVMDTYADPHQPNPHSPLSSELVVTQLQDYIARILYGVAP